MSYRTRTCTGVALAFVVLAAAGCDVSKPTSPTSHVGDTPGAVNYVLSGIVFETTAAGRAPVAGATVEVSVCPPALEHVGRAVTDDAGHYSVSGVCTIPHINYVWVTKLGYATKPPTPCDGDCLSVQVVGIDARFDAEVFRR